MNLATKIPNLDVDLTKEAQGSIDYLRYQQARDLVLQTASDFPLRTLFSNSDQQNGTLVSLATLESYTYPDTDSNGDPYNYDAALIFPAESLILDSTGSAIEHRTLPSTSQSSSQGKLSLIKQHPVILQLRARIKPISPFIQPITIESTAMGFREEVPRGPLTGEYGLSDPTPNPNNSSSSSSNGPGLRAIHHSNENLNYQCNPDLLICALDPTKPCPDLNSNANAATGACEGCLACSINPNPKYNESAF